MSISTHSKITLLLALTGIAGQYLGHANIVWHFPLLALLFPFALTLLGERAVSNGQAFRHAMLTAIPALSMCLFWLTVPMEEQTGMEWYLALPIPIVVSAYLALYPACYSILARQANRLFLSGPDQKPILHSIFLGLSWGALEYLCGILLTGFPWLKLSTAFAPWTIAIQPVSFLGAYAYSGVLVTGLLLVMHTVRILWKKREQTRSKQVGTHAVPHATQAHSLRNGLKTAGAATILFGACCGWSFYTLHTPLTTPASTGNEQSKAEITVAFIQANIDQGLKWNPTFQRGTVDRYISMSKVAAEKLSRKNQAPDLILWPETSMPFYVQEKNQYQKDLRTLAITGEAAYIIGSPGYSAGTEGRDFDAYNRAYLLLPTGVFSGHYDKEHLVPFGEYIPLGLTIPFLDEIFDGSGTFVPGDPSPPLKYQNLALGMLICYEAIFPELARQRVSQGANILVNISNDAWFGKTGAPFQHLHMAVLRAVEQGRYLVRGTNTGISAIIDPNGRIVTCGGLYRAEIISGQATLLTGTTPYYTLAPYLHALFIGIPIAILLITRRKCKQQSEHS